MSAEAAPSQNGFATVAVLGDLHKAYEQVNLAVAWRAAQVSGFPLRLAAWVTALFTNPRWLVFDGSALDQPMYPHCGPPAGSRFADTWLRMVLTKPMDTFIARQPSIDTSVYVDDFGLMAHGRVTRIVEHMPTAVANLVDVIRQAGLAFANDKWQIVASSPKIAEAIAVKARKLHIPLKVVGAARNLGADFTAGKAASVTVRNSRVDAVKSRTGRLHALKAAGIDASKFFHTASSPLGLYSTDVSGIGNHQLHGMRNAAAAAAPGGIRHRNVGLVLALVARPRYDLIYRATEAPVYAWACAVWEKYKPTQLKFATDAAKAHTGWAQVRGPAGP